MRSSSSPAHAGVKRGGHRSSVPPRLAPVPFAIFCALRGSAGNHSLIPNFGRRARIRDVVESIQGLCLTLVSRAEAVLRLFTFSSGGSSCKSFDFPPKVWGFKKRLSIQVFCQCLATLLHSNLYDNFLHKYFQSLTCIVALNVCCLKIYTVCNSE